MKITDLKSVMIQGIPWTWTLVKVETDRGVSGIAERGCPSVSETSWREWKDVPPSQNGK